MLFFQVYINVIDINDNSPMFLSPSYQTTIPENTEVGMSILKVSAMDRDENNRLFYTITAAENRISIKKFDIDSRTGKSTPITGYLSGKNIYNGPSFYTAPL